MTGFTCIWEFRIRPERRGEFERHYGADGMWATLFRQASGYRGTVLLRDREGSSRYVTIDRWEDAGSYRAFRQQFSDEYHRLDEQCAALTMEENLIGEFAELHGGATEEGAKI